MKLPEGAKVKITHFRVCGECDEVHPAGLYRRENCTQDMLPRGGRTRAEVLLPDGRIVTGEAHCSTLDNFSRKRGREIAIGRALKEAQAVAADVGL